MSITITSSERVLFVGATGSGKTVLAKRLLASLSRVIVIDPKHTFTLDGFSRLYSYRLPIFARKFSVIVRPVRGDDLKLRSFIEHATRDGNVTIYIDELASMVDRFPLTVQTLEDLARTGRELFISLWTAVQRPRWIPKIFVTETETVFLFGLRSLDDRQYISGFVGDVANEKLNEFEFLYCRTDANTNPQRLKLNLDNGQLLRVGKE